MYRLVKTWINSLISLFFPDCCCACGRLLVGSESFLCLRCLGDMPVTATFLHDSNVVEMRLRGRFYFRKAAAFLHFEKGGMTQKIVHRIKYKGDEKLGVRCGEIMYSSIKDSGYFEGIDFIVPVPLHPARKRQRGFNQAEAIAQGISSLSGIPVNTRHLIKVKKNDSQTKRSRYDRWLNSKETFSVVDTTALAGKHILLVDDVITTGATIEACAQSLLRCDELSISVLTWAVSR